LHALRYVQKDLGIGRNSGSANAFVEQQFADTITQPLSLIRSQPFHYKTPNPLHSIHFASIKPTTTMEDRREILEESDTRPTAPNSRLVQHADDKDYPDRGPTEVSARNPDRHDADDDNRNRTADIDPRSKLEAPLGTHWGTTRPASIEVRMGLQIGSLITAPIPQFAKDPRGKEKTKDGFFASPHGMMLVKRYPLTVYNVDRDNARMPTKLYCMQRHTYGKSGLWKDGRLRDDHHVHVKLLPPGGNIADKGDAENDPLLVRELYNNKSIADNAYLEFKSIFVVELDEHVELDGQLETSSWLRLFGMHLSTHMNTVLLQLESSPGRKEEAKEIVNDLVKAFAKKAGGKNEAMHAGQSQNTTINETTAQTQVVYGELNGQANSASSIAQNQLISTRHGNASQQTTDVYSPWERSEGREPRRRSRSPGAELQPFRERDDRYEGNDQPRYQPRTYEDERTRRAQGGDWPHSRDRGERHTVRESRHGERDHRSDRDTNPMPLNRYYADSEGRRSDRRYDSPGGREQGRGGRPGAWGRGTQMGRGRGGRGGRGG